MAKLSFFLASLLGAAVVHCTPAVSGTTDRITLTVSVLSYPYTSCTGVLEMLLIALCYETSPVHWNPLYT